MGIFPSPLVSITNQRNTIMENITKLLAKEIEAQTKVTAIGIEIDAMISESFKVEDPEAIANIKSLLAKNLMGDDSIVEGYEFEPEKGVLKDFEDVDAMAHKIWETVNNSAKPLCSLDVWTKLSKKWNISKSQTNGILVTRQTWFRKLKKKMNDENNMVYFYRAKA